MMLIAVAAALYGLDKSLAPGAGILAVACLAGVMPAKDATGLTLIMAIVADWSAIWVYRNDVVVRTLLRLLPSVAVGVVVGAGFLFAADNRTMRLTIGVILAAFVGAYFMSLLRKTLARRRPANHGHGDPEAPSGRTAPVTSGALFHVPDRGVAGGASWWTAMLSRLKHVGFGALAGFTTMVANAGGPVTSIYFMTEKLPVTKFLGTTAWFYLIINMVKLPFSVGLGMITPTNFMSIVWVIPVVMLSVICGRWLAKRVSQSFFTVVVYVFAVVAVVQLFL